MAVGSGWVRSMRELRHLQPSSTAPNAGLQQRTRGVKPSCKVRHLQQPTKELTLIAEQQQQSREC